MLFNSKYYDSKDNWIPSNQCKPAHVGIYGVKIKYSPKDPADQIKGVRYVKEPPKEFAKNMLYWDGKEWLWYSLLDSKPTTVPCKAFGASKFHVWRGIPPTQWFHKSNPTIVGDYEVLEKLDVISMYHWDGSNWITPNGNIYRIRPRWRGLIVNPI